SVAAEITERVCFQNQLRGDGRSVFAAVKADAWSRTFEQHGHRNHRFVERRKAQIPGVAALLVIKNRFPMLSDDVAFEVMLSYEFLLRLTCLWIDYRHILLSRSRFAAGANAR